MATISIKQNNIKVKSKSKCKEIRKALRSPNSKVDHIDNGARIATKEEAIKFIDKWYK